MTYDCRITGVASGNSNASRIRASFHCRRRVGPLCSHPSKMATAKFVTSRGGRVPSAVADASGSGDADRSDGDAVAVAPAFRRKWWWDGLEGVRHLEQHIHLSAHGVVLRQLVGRLEFVDFAFGVA
jgi:hypothetical protein